MTAPKLGENDEDDDYQDDDYERADLYCLHDDFDHDWDGAATCNHCGYRWFLTAAEMEQMAKWYEEYHEQCDREEQKRHG